MKQLSKVIHPEIILGLRGLKKYQELHDLHKELISRIRYSDVHKAYECTGSLAVSFFQRDPISFSFHVLMKKFIESKEKKVFYIPKDFAQTLSKIDRGVPSSVLKPGFIAYFQLADGALFDEKSPIQGAYVSVDYGSEMGDLKSEQKKLEICVTYVCEDMSVAKFMFPVDDEKKLENMMGDYPQIDFVLSGNDDVLKEQKADFRDFPLRCAAFRCFINAAIYVHSADPEIANLLPVSSLNKTQRQAGRNKYSMENLCMLPMQVLNRSYALGRNYSVDSTIVESHPRWQRCGENFSEVKLIFVKEHERHYK